MLANPIYLRHRTEMAFDPLSDILTLFNTRSLITGGLIAGGDWALSFPQPKAIKFSAVIKGSCWLCLEGAGPPIRMETGDVYLLNGKHPLILASNMAVEPIDAMAFFAGKTGTTRRIGTRDEFRLLGGHVALDPSGRDLLFEALPPVIHVRAGTAEATVIRWLIDQLVQEMATPRPGATLVSGQLAQLMFVQVLRAHISGSAPLSVGWLRAIGDERISPAIQLMHRDPGRNWQLGELAKAVGMSRTTFALRFKAAAGMAPLSYLLNWRMRLAEQALRDGTTPVAVVAQSLGYTSESAFSNAFKREIGIAPTRYRNSARTLDGGMPDEDDVAEAYDITAPAMAEPFKVASGPAGENAPRSPG